MRNTPEFLHGSSSDINGDRVPLTVFMASLLEAVWMYLISHFSDFQLASLGSFFLHERVFFLSGLHFIFFERAGYLRKYKIQTKNNTPAAQEKCITRLMLTCCIILDIPYR